MTHPTLQPEQILAPFFYLKIKINETKDLIFVTIVLCIRMVLLTLLVLILFFLRHIVGSFKTNILPIYKLLFFVQGKGKSHWGLPCMCKLECFSFGRDNLAQCLETP